MPQIQQNRILPLSTDAGLSLSHPANLPVDGTAKERTYWDYYVDPSISWYDRALAGAALPVAGILSLGGCIGTLDIVKYENICPDNDGDGHDDLTCGGDDCNDSITAVNPNAQEICNGMDDNCDGQIDEGVLATFYQDTDSDGYGNLSSTQEACTAPAGYVTDPTDCNDGNASVNPGASEICNQIDDNCNGEVDEGLPTSTYYQDADSDGYGNPDQPLISCAQPDGYVTDNSDCDDANAQVHPGMIIQDAVNAASDGDVVNICDGTYLEHLVIDKSITLEGMGNVILDGNDDSLPLVTAEGNYAFNFDNINFTRGGAIFIYGPSNVNFSDCSFYGNTTYSNGHADVVSIYLGITVLGVFQTTDGSPALAVTNSDFFDNDCNANDFTTASSCIITSGSASFENVSFENNTSDEAILRTNSDLTIDNSYFYSNIVADGGETTGMVYASDGAQVVINNSTFTGNSAETASTILLYNSSGVTLDSCVVENNSSLDLYGAVLLYADTDTKFYSVDTNWNGNDPYDVTIDIGAANYDYTAGSATNFECTGTSGSCY